MHKKNSKVFFLILCILGVLFFSKPAFASEGEILYKFIHLTDPQFGQVSWNITTFPESKWYASAIQKINKIKPDFLVVTGDMVNLPKSDRQRIIFEKTHKNLDPKIKTYFVPGNHDIGDTPKPKYLNWYREHFGKDWDSVEYKNTLMIMVNTPIMKSPVEVEDELQKQNQWIESLPEKYKDKEYSHIFIFMHHPLFLEDLLEKESYWVLPEKIRLKYWKIFKALNVSTIFTGHYHRNHVRSHDGIDVIATAPTTKALEGESGFRIVTVYQDRIDSEFIPI